MGPSIQPLRAIVEHFAGKKGIGFYDKLACGHVVSCPLWHHDLDGRQRSRPTRRRCPECVPVNVR
jgi:hypothetical protein